MATSERDVKTTTVMSVHELKGRPVFTESGERLGIIRDVDLGADGEIRSLHLRERWMLGPHREIPAAGLRVEGGDVFVPDSVREIEHKADRDPDQEPVPESVAAPVGATSTVLLVGRDGARGRFGGIDIVGSLLGALVVIGSLVLIGGLLAAAFGTETLVINTAAGTFALVTSETVLVGAAAIFLSFFLGGWAAGRSARFDGVLNGLVTALWVLVLGIAFGALGAWVGDEYDIYASTALPSFVTDDFEMWGSVAFAVALVLMLAAGALGGALGESWHRRADRAMFDVVSTTDEP